MSPDSKKKLRNLLLQHESYKQFPYVDTTSHLTIGIGRNLSDRGISQTEALMLLEDDISYFVKKLSQYCDFFDGLDENRQIALIDMCFNLGINGFLSFNKMIDALRKKDYVTAAQEMLSSQWADQVKQRALDLAYVIRTGDF